MSKGNKDNMNTSVQEFMETFAKCETNPSGLIIGIIKADGDMRLWTVHDDGFRFNLIAMARLIDKQIMDGLIVSNSEIVSNYVVERKH